MDGPLIHELFEAQVSRTPDRVAVVVGHRRVRYRELDAMANGVARRLVSDGVQPGELVGVCMGRDERLIATLLGVFKAGAAYVPLDPAYPADRLAFIGEDAQLTRIVVTGEHHDLASTTGGTAVLFDEIAPAGTAPVAAVPPGGCAYVVYTSGSTGRPKGVVIEHDGAANFIRWAVSTMDDREMAGSLAGLSVCFDGSTLEIFPPLACGGAVIVAESPLELATLPARDEVTMVVAPPSALRVMLQHGLPASVRLVYPVGEALPSALVAALFAQPGVRRVRNGYGPTETTTLSHCHDMFRETFVDTGEPPPIGRLVAGAQAVLLGADGREVAEGEVGEMWIAGPGVAGGYLRRPELTAQRFVAGTGAGARRYRTGDLVRRRGQTYHYLGRVDDQVKIRGFRVELGEVESTLAGHPGVAAAVATAPADEYGVRTLFAYAELVPGAATSEEELRDFVAQRLPAYLVPSRIGIVDAIPLGPTGKANRSALPALAPAVSRTASPAPRDEREVAVASVFAQVLGLAAVGVHDDFFALGGHSLLGGLAVARISEALGVSVPLAWLLNEPTVAALAARIEAGGDEEPRGRRHTGQTAYPLTFMQTNQWLGLRAAPQATNTIAFELRVDGLTDGAALQAALDAMVSRHEVLRSVLVLAGEWPTAEVRPPASVPLIQIGSPTDPAAVEDAIASAVSHVFDLYTDTPLMRVTLIWTGPSRARMIVVTDHVAFDGYSIGIFAEELAESLAAAAAGEPDPVAPPPLQIGDVAILQRELAQRPRLEAMRQFWGTEVAGSNSPNLPGSLRELFPVLGRRVVHVLDQDAQDRLRSLEVACGATRFVVFVTALGILLARHTGASDNLLGAVTALRDRPGLDRVIGPLYEVVVVRVRVDEGASFHQLSESVAQARSRALANQEVGFRAIMEAAYPGEPLTVSQQLTPVVLSMQPDTVSVAVARGPVRIELVGELDTGASPLCDLAVLVNASADGLQLHLMYDTARFEPNEMDTFMHELIEVLDAAAAGPDQPVGGKR